MLTDQSSFIVLCHCYRDRDDTKTAMNRDLTGQSSFGAFIELTGQPDKQLMEPYWSLMPAASFHPGRQLISSNVSLMSGTRHIMWDGKKIKGIKRIHLDKVWPSFCFFRVTWHQEKATCHRISSPTHQHSSHGCDSSGVCGRVCPSPPQRRRTSAAARPLRRGPLALPGAAAPSLGEAATRLAAGHGVSERELLENSQGEHP